MFILCLNTMTSMINTNVFFDFMIFSLCPKNCSKNGVCVAGQCVCYAGWVREVFVVHVGGTRCVTSSTGNNMNIHARITWTVEFIRTCIVLF